MSEKEDLLKVLNELKQEQNKLWEQKKPIEKRLKVLYKEIEKFQKKYDTIEVNEKKLITIDDLLTETPQSSDVMDNYKQKVLEEMTGLPHYQFSCDSIFVRTKHKCIRIALIKGDVIQNEKITKAIELFLPYMKECVIINKKPIKYISIFDRDLHESRSVCLVIDGNNYSLYNEYSKETLFTFNTLTEAVSKIADKFYYKSIYEEEEYV